MDTPSLSGIGKLHKGLFDGQGFAGGDRLGHPLSLQTV